MPLTLKSTLKLNNGISIPLLGLGVYLLRPGTESYQSVKAALDTGYRLVDTASFYGNEEDVGKAVRDSVVPREESSSQPSSGTTTTVTIPYIEPLTLPSSTWVSATLIST